MFNLKYLIMSYSTILTRSMVCVAAMCFSSLAVSAAAEKEIITFDVTRPVDSDNTTLTSCGLNSKYLALRMGCLSVEQLESALSKGTVKFIAKQGTTTTWYNTSSFGAYGHTFSTKGIAVASSTHRNAALMSKYEKGEFLVGHIPAKVVEGETYTFTQAFVKETDTLAYVFNVTIGQTESVSSDQPGLDESFVHRKDYTYD